MWESLLATRIKLGTIPAPASVRSPPAHPRVRPRYPSPPDEPGSGDPPQEQRLEQQQEVSLAVDGVPEDPDRCPREDHPPASGLTTRDFEPTPAEHSRWAGVFGCRDSSFLPRCWRQERNRAQARARRHALLLEALQARAIFGGGLSLRRDSVRPEAGKEEKRPLGLDVL